MSRIGRKAIALPKGVEVKIDGQHVFVKGAKGSLEMDVMNNIAVAVEDGQLHVTRANDDKPVRAAHGMTRALISNMVDGVSNGFQKVLEIVGVGYRAQMQGKNLVLSLGFSHPVEVVPPAGIEFACESPIKIIAASTSSLSVRSHRTFADIVRPNPTRARESDMPANM